MMTMKLLTIILLFLEFQIHFIIHSIPKCLNLPTTYLSQSFHHSPSSVVDADSLVEFLLMNNTFAKVTYTNKVFNPEDSSLFTQTSLVFSDRTEIQGNSTEMSLYRFTNLITFSSGDYSFRSVRKLLIEDLPNLKNITIGEGAFTMSIAGQRAADGNKLVIDGCGNLETIEIGDYAFADYTEVRFSGLAKLRSITIGGNVVGGSCNFMHSTYFMLSSK